MSTRTPSATFESRDVLIFDFKDTDLRRATADRSTQDESLRHYLSQWFVNDLKIEPHHPHLERILALAREREQFCRGANDFFGLARCLGNQALIQKARGHFEEALALLNQLEALSRRIEDVEGLAFALSHQAMLLASSLGKPAAALPLAEQAQALASENHLSQLAGYIAPLVQRLRAHDPAL